MEEEREPTMKDLIVAAESDNAVRYADLCERLCYDDNGLRHHELIERAEAESISEQRIDSDRQNMVHDEPYLDFYRESIKRRIRPEDIWVQADAKGELLASYFEKFSEGGKQDLRGKHPTYVGTVFKKLYAAAERIAKKAS